MNTDDGCTDFMALNTDVWCKDAYKCKMAYSSTEVSPPTKVSIGTKLIHNSKSD